MWWLQGSGLCECGNIQSQPLLIWLMWRGVKSVGTYLSSFPKYPWADGQVVKCGVLNSTEVSEESVGSILEKVTFFKWL
jgi:hypothetical protein